MTILVTGAAGFIGSNFVTNWLNKSEEPIVSIDSLTYSGNLHNLDLVRENVRHEFLLADIGNSQIIHNALRNFKPRAIINFAAETHVDRSIHSPIKFIETNVLSTANFLESIRDYWLELNNIQKNHFRFIHISTDEVFGSLGEGEPSFKETNNYLPNSPYSASKAASDHLARAWYHTYGLPTIITNCSNNYGPRQFPEKLIPLCIVNALSGNPLPIYGDGKQIRDWLYVDDHCDAIKIVLEKGKVGDTYNIGGGHETTNKEVVGKICEWLDKIQPRENNKSYAEQITFIKDRPGHDRRYAIDSTKLTKEFNWTPKETFDSGLLKTINWYLSNGDWLHAVLNGEYKNWLNQQYNH